MDDAALPGMPTPPEASSRAVKAGIKVTRVKTTKLCEQCCRDIHTYGVQQAPYPQVGRWRLVFDDLTTERLCEGHKNERTT